MDVSACAAHVNMECWAHHNINLSVVIINQRYQHLRDAWEQENDKDDLKMDLQGLERQFWLRMEAGRMGCYELPGEIWAGYESAHKGGMGVAKGGCGWH